MKLKSILVVLFFLALGMGAGRLITSSMADGKSANTAALSRRSASGEGLGDVASSKVSSGKSSQRFAAMAKKWEKGELPDDWNAELRTIIALPEEAGFDLDKALRLYFSKWAEKDFDTAMKMAGKTGVMAEELKAKIFTEYAERDPKAALAYYEKHKEACDEYDFCLDAIAKNWGRTSPEEAFAWCDSFEVPTEKNAETIKFSRVQAWSSFMNGLFQSNDLKLISTYLEKIRVENGDIPNPIIQNWAGINPDQVVEWIRAHKEDKGNSYISEAVAEMININLQKAEELLAMLDDQERSSLVNEMIINVRFTQGEEAALNWAKKQIPLSDFKNLSFMVLSGWSSQNQKAATQWVRDLPPSAGKDKITAAYVSNLVKGKVNSEVYETAMALIQDMSDANKKEAILKEISREWKGVDPSKYQKQKEK